MNVLSAAIVFFIIMESMNVIILYFFPHTFLGNGVGVFDDYMDNRNTELSLFHSYMVNWVAGVKLIFIFLLVVILLLGDDRIKLWADIAMVLSIATYYFRLNRIIRELDRRNRIHPKGYSVGLFWMITAFMAVFSLSIVIFLFL